MALAKKCDRCGKFYEVYNTRNDSKNISGIMTLNIDDRGKYYSHKPLDLCPKCKDAFKPKSLIIRRVDIYGIRSWKVL